MRHLIVIVAVALLGCDSELSYEDGRRGSVCSKLKKDMDTAFMEWVACGDNFPGKYPEDACSPYVIRHAEVQMLWNRYCDKLGAQNRKVSDEWRREKSPFTSKM